MTMVGWPLAGDRGDSETSGGWSLAEDRGDSEKWWGGHWQEAVELVAGYLQNTGKLVRTVLPR